MINIDMCDHIQNVVTEIWLSKIVTYVQTYGSIKKQMLHIFTKKCLACFCLV